MQFNRDIVTLAKKNEYFRQEVVTGMHCKAEADAAEHAYKGSVSCNIRQ